jgi:hypothetical protein
MEREENDQTMEKGENDQTMVKEENDQTMRIGITMMERDGRELRDRAMVRDGIEITMMENDLLILEDPAMVVIEVIVLALAVIAVEITIMTVMVEERNAPTDSSSQSKRMFPYL